MDLSAHGIVALVRNQAGEFLLLRDARDQMKGYWAPPHGRCEPTDASEEDGLIREVKEETSLLVQPIRKVFTQPADTKVKTVSFWTVSNDDCEPSLNEESSAFGWYGIDAALGLRLYPGTRVFFEKLQSGELHL